MCGIVGLINRERTITPSDNERIRRILSKIAYRGPDGMGVWQSENILLGHRRLSIIDLSPAGAQPFVDQLHGLVITYNGEIYNYQEIRTELIEKGYAFQSQTDTEVILFAYDHYGVNFLRRLRGMFAFCLIDQKKQKVILARDPAGEKPLYYYFDSKCMFFSSEIKSFHGLPEIDLSIDEESVKAFFTLQYIPGPHTIYSHIKRLMAGTVLEIDLVEWNAITREHWSHENIDPEHAATPEEIEHLLARSVRERLVADVEVGLLLSGGIDSSLLAWYARQAKVNVRVFSAYFDRDDLNEVEYARQVANSLGMEQVVINGGTLDGDLFDEIIFHADEPLGDPACIPTYLLAKELTKYVTVVLSGEGADELFWGYDTYRYEKLWLDVSWMHKLINPIPWLKYLASEMESNPQIPAGVTRAAKLLTARYDLGAARWTTVFSDHTIKSIMPKAGDTTSQYLQEMEAKVKSYQSRESCFRGSLSVDLHYWLPDDLLTKVDRMTMAHSVEARAPFLDPDLMLAALSLPEKYKVNNNEGKLILRDLVGKKFPGNTGRKLSKRRKHGFEVPVSEWLKHTLRERAEEMFSPNRLSQSGLIDMKYTNALWKTFLRSHGDLPIRRKLWLLLCFQSWYECHQNHFGFRVDS
ncbi:MAG TPA: asparagine synthase (glutamine-hydrolyzing) [Anaerolineales bacterium]|jgi:asparagine synthase (glutamine-hydrolysing)